MSEGMGQSAGSGDSPAAGPPPRLPPYLGSDRQNAGDSGEMHDQQTVNGPAPPAGPRPFVLTRGRVTGEAPDIGLETQVTVVDQVRAGVKAAETLSSELQSIVALCVQPMSVAEISARLRLQLGVTKVLVGDLRAAGQVVVHVEDVPDPRSPDLILRVIDGLRAIS